MNSKKIRNKMYKVFYFEKFIVIVITIFLIINNSFFTTAQSSANLPCYSITQELGEPGILYEFNPNETDPTVSRWRRIGSTNRFNIQSIAINIQNSTIYAVDSGMLGKINPITAAFDTIGRIGAGFGDFGYIEFNNIRGLAFSSMDSMLYATHNVPGFATNSHDLLIKINPSTGQLIQQAMVDSLGSSVVDYARIEKTNSWTVNALPIRDINDIAFHPFSGQLYAFHKQGYPAVLSILNQTDGNIEQIINDVSELDVGGLGFDSEANLYGTSMANSIDSTLSTYRLFDTFVGTSSSLGAVDASIGQRTSFICFDCSKQILKYEVCNEEAINVSNYVAKEPHYSSKKTLNSNASLLLSSPITFTAAEELNFYKNFEILIDTTNIDTTQFQIDSLAIFSAKIENCQ